MQRGRFRVRQIAVVVAAFAAVAGAGLAAECGLRRTGTHAFRTRSAPASSSAPVVPGTISALALGWGGSARADVDAQPLNGDHQLSLRFMAAYEAAFRGVLLADESGSYRVGLAPYAALEAAALEVQVGGASASYPLPAPTLTNNDFRAGVPRQPRAQWRRLTVSRRGDRVTIRLDGVSLGELTAGSVRATGKLRLGRLAEPDGAQDQFYGLLSEVALDERPLPSASLSLRGSASWISVSSDGDAALDAARLPQPTHATRFTLPFAEQQVWLVIQGVNSALSHNDRAAFALDFIRVDPRFVRANPGRVPGGSHRESDGAPLVAAASGRVASVVDCFANDNRGQCASDPREAAPSAHVSARNRNLICVEHRAGETTCLLHLQQRSARVALGARVERGEPLGLAGMTGVPAPHLHFALCDRAEPNEPGAFNELVSVPVAFDDYFASDDFGETWRHVSRGTPVPGQWLTRTQPAPR